MLCYFLVLCIYMHIHIFFFRFFSIIVFYKIVNVVLCVIQQDFAYLVFYRCCNKSPHIQRFKAVLIYYLTVLEARNPKINFFRLKSRCCESLIPLEALGRTLLLASSSPHRRPALLGSGHLPRPSSQQQLLHSSRTSASVLTASLTLIFLLPPQSSVLYCCCCCCCC